MTKDNVLPLAGRESITALASAARPLREQLEEFDRQNSPNVCTYQPVSGGCAYFLHAL